MTSGAEDGTSGARRPPAWAVAYIILAVFTLVITTVNVLSYLDERDWQGRPIDWWEPALWEGSSGIVFLAIAWTVMLAVRRFPLGGRAWPRHLAIHAAITLPFSLVHVILMVALRHLVYAFTDESYDFGLGWETFLYEYRKDVVSYALFVALFGLTDRLLGTGTPSAASAPAPPENGNVVIDEGQRRIRVPPREILAVRSCGNYVEFLLADGRRPLMRTILANIAAELAGYGFERSHRSWLVNAAHVVEIEAEGSGDYGLTLGDGTKVPVSRRYPKAIEALRRG